MRPSLSFNRFSYIPHFVQRRFSPNQVPFKAVSSNTDKYSTVNRQLNTHAHKPTSWNSNPKETIWAMFSRWLAETRFQALESCQTHSPSGSCVASNLLFFPTHGKGNTVKCPGDAPHPLPWGLPLTGAFQFNKVCNVVCRFI